MSISAGLFAGLTREAAARFSFLMATPVIAGAGLFEAAQPAQRATPGWRSRSAPLVVGHGRRPRLRSVGDHDHAALRAHPLLRDLRGRAPGRGRARRRRCSCRDEAVVRTDPGRASSSAGTCAMEVMKQLRQRSIRDLVEQRVIRTQQELAAALRERGFRTTQATISRDVAELGPDQGQPRGHPGLRPAAAPGRGRDQRRGSAAQALPRPAQSRSARPACCSSSGPCPARPTRSRPPSTAPAGRRWPAPSRATTPCSWPSPIAARWAGSSAPAAPDGVAPSSPMAAPSVARFDTGSGAK